MNPVPPHCAYLVAVHVATGGLDVVVEVVVVTLVELLVVLALVELVEEVVGLTLVEELVEDLEVAVLVLPAVDELEEPPPPPLTVPDA